MKEELTECRIGFEVHEEDGRVCKLKITGDAFQGEIIFGPDNPFSVMPIEVQTLGIRHLANKTVQTLQTMLKQFYMAVEAAKASLGDDLESKLFKARDDKPKERVIN